MTMEEITGGKTGKDLASLGDKELLELFEKEGMLNITRPDRVDRTVVRAQVAHREEGRTLSPDKLEKLRNLAKQQGLDLGDLI